MSRRRTSGPVHFLLLAALAAAASTVACSGSSDIGSDEPEFSVPQVKELMAADDLGFVTSTVGKGGAIHAVLSKTGKSFHRAELWYVTNASPNKQWTTTKITSTDALITKNGQPLATPPNWAVFQQSAIAADEQGRVSIAFELDTDASGQRRHSLMVLEVAAPTTPQVVVENKSGFDFAFAAGNGKLHLAYAPTEPHAPTKADDIQYRSRAAGANAFGAEVPLKCLGVNAATDGTIRKDFAVQVDAGGRAHVLCSADSTLSHTAELQPGSGTFGAGELVQVANKSDHIGFGVAPDGAPHAANVTFRGGLYAVQRAGNGWADRRVFDQSEGQPPAHADGDMPDYPVVAEVAQAFGSNGKPSLVAVINKYAKNNTRERQTLAFFGPGGKRHDLTTVDPQSDVWNLAFTVDPSTNDAVVLFTTIGSAQSKLFVME